MKATFQVPESQIPTERLALYTTVYPGVERYLPSWYESVLAQTDRNFDIWIGVDGLDVSAVIAAMSAGPSATWVMAARGDSPAQIRHKAIARMVRKYPAVVFADSDDLLDPTRVEAARRSLKESDVSGCAMRIIGEHGNDLGIVLEPPGGQAIGGLLIRTNVFGLSNTAYRSHVLGRCLPIPPECVLVDWFLVTRAWTLAGRLDFDFTCRMAYRQHSHNTAPLVPPFTPQRVTLATKLVLDHYTLVLEKVPELQPQHRAELEAARNRAKAFYMSIEGSPDILRQYVQALNKLPTNHMWWACVAHPQLQDIWTN